MNPLISHEQLQDGVNNDARVDQVHTLSSCHIQHAGKAQKHPSVIAWIGCIAAPILLVYVIPVVKQLLLRNGNIEFLFAMNKDPALRNFYLTADMIMSICWAFILIGVILTLLKYTKEDQAKVSCVLMIEAVAILVFELCVRLTPVDPYILVYAPANMTLPVIAVVSYIVVWGYIMRARSKMRKQDQDATLV